MVPCPSYLPLSSSPPLSSPFPARRPDLRSGPRQGTIRRPETAGHGTQVSTIFFRLVYRQGRRREANLFNSGAGIVALSGLGVAVLALVGVVVLLIRQQRLATRYKAFMRGASGASLEDVLSAHVKELDSTACRVKDVERLATRLDTEAMTSIRHVGVVRYNPFRDTGGDQSFAIVLADGHGDGVVFSSLHTRDATRVYAKPLAGWTSSYTLTDEEKSAISMANGRGEV